MGRVRHQLGRGIDLEQAKIRSARDVQQHPLSAVHARLQERRGDGLFGRDNGAVVSAGAPDTHQRAARMRHDGLDIGEVEVDQTRRGNEIGNALNTGEQDLVRAAERVQHTDVTIRHRQQPVVRNDDERVNFITQGVDSRIRLGCPAAPFERERAGDDTDGQRAERPGDVGHHRRAAGAGTTAFPRGHEHHVGALEDLFDLLAMIFGSLATDLRVGARAESSGELPADVELDVGVAHQQGLGVGIDRDELDTLEPNLDHAVDGVDAATANPDDLDHRQVVLRSCHAVSVLQRHRWADGGHAPAARCSGEGGAEWMERGTADELQPSPSARRLMLCQLPTVDRTVGTRSAGVKDAPGASPGTFASIGSHHCAPGKRSPPIPQTRVLCRATSHPLTRLNLGR